jgi:hypothetical protein
MKILHNIIIRFILLNEISTLDIILVLHQEMAAAYVREKEFMQHGCQRLVPREQKSHPLQ